MSCRYGTLQVLLPSKMLKKEGMEPDDLLCSRNARSRRSISPHP
jgi:hypothetical protein